MVKRFVSAALCGLGLTLSSACALVLGFEDHQPFPPEAGVTADGSDDGPTSVDAGPIDDAGRDAQSSVLARGPLGARGIAVDGTTVYWAVESDKSVRAVDKNGGEARVARQLLAKPADGTPGDVAVDALYVYVGVTSPVTDYIQGCEVVRFEKGQLDAAAGFGCVLSMPNLSNVLKRFVLNGAFIYGSGAFYNTGESVFQVGVDGTNPTTPVKQEKGIGPVVSAGSDLYYVKSGGTTIVRFPKPGGPGVDFATGQATVLDLAADDTAVYWVTEGGSVSKLALGVDAGTPEVLASGQASPYRLALDATNVYFTAASGGTVSFVPKNGGAAARALASGLVSPRSLALDETSIYATCDDGAVIKIPKP